MEVGRLRRRDGAEHQPCHHPEIAGAGPTQRPEQLWVVVIVAVQNATVGQNDLGGDQPVGCNPITAAEDPQPTTQSQSGHPDRGQVPAGMVN